MTTYKETVKALERGENIVIFPESPKEYNNIINDFQDKFVDVSRLYYARTGKPLAFVPAYHAVELKKVVFGDPIFFDPNKDMNEQRKEIVTYLKEKITDIATDLPVHTVVPYANINKKLYPKSK